MEETLAIGLAVRLLMEETLTNGAGSVTVNDGGNISYWVGSATINGGDIN